MRNKERGKSAGLPIQATQILWVILATLIADHGLADASGRVPPTDCPYVEPMHGLLPLLFSVGLLPRPTMAATIAPSDTRSSVVIRPDSTQQIRFRADAVTVIHDVAFAHPALRNGKAKELEMDILVPQPFKGRPLVVYVTGCGFSRAAKEAALNLRTYVAEAGFVVASVEYRTDRDSATYRDGILRLTSAVRYLPI